VFNVDDAFGAGLATAAAPGRSIVVARTAEGRGVAAQLERAGGAQALRAEAVRATPAGLAFRVAGAFGDAGVQVALIGEFNVDNALLVLGCLLALELPLEAAVAALAQCRAPSGRMEAIGGDERPLAIVDYAHSPDALAKALRAARAHCDGRLHVVFGCGGERDAGKRPQMAAIAAQLADVVVLTDDNPRGESPQGIVADIVAGLPAGVVATVIHDREQAIRTALGAARAGDVVLIAGKGHEDYQIVGGQRRPFSDQSVVRDALRLAA
jgi:UDP-N-acetylmuramoyl-L-alanyl-D-glutamate--2,6-diaminopimelate ligase